MLFNMGDPCLHTMGTFTGPPSPPGGPIRLGQVVTKPTSFSTTLPLDHWHDLYCNHGKHEVSEDLKSSDLSRYPAQLMQDLAPSSRQLGRAFSCTHRRCNHSLQKNLGWNPLRQSPPGATPRQRAYIVTTAALATITPPTANHTPAWHTLLEKSQAIPATLQVAVQDPVLMMQAAFRCRLIRDGGGKPSPGRLTPPQSSTESIGKQGSAHHGPTLFMGGTHPVVHPADRQNTPTSSTNPRVHQTHPGPE